MYFQFEARIDGSFLSQANDPLAPHGSVLYGRFSYDDDVALQGGGHYYFDPGEEELSIFTDEGFNLPLSNRVTYVAPTSFGDFFGVQSFVSEDPNGWHIVLDLQAENWLGGTTGLPETFPTSFTHGYVSAYFTDEGDWVRTIDATLVSIELVELAANDLYEAKSFDDGWIRLGALNDNTGLLDNDAEGARIAFFEAGGEKYAADGVWRDASGGGQIRVFESGVFDFRNQGELLENGDSAQFQYTVEKNGETDAAEVNINFKQGFQPPTDDAFTITSAELSEAGRGWFRLAAHNDGTGILQNDLGTDQLILVDGEEVVPGEWFAGTSGGQFRVFAGGVVDFRNQGDLVVPGDATGFSYGVLSPDKAVETATVFLNVDEPDLF